MPEKLHSILSMLPFLLLTTEKKIKMNWARVGEALLIAGATAVLTAYISLRELRVEVIAIKTTQEEFKKDTNERIRCVENRVYDLASQRGE